MALTTAPTRSRSLAATVAAALLCGLCASVAAPAIAIPGGTAPTSGTRVSKTSTSPHVTTVRITGVGCIPVSRCSGNPHQVSTRGTLLIAGKGLAAGMSVAFPRTPGARLGLSSPIAHLHNAAAGLIATVPNSAHSGHIMVLLSGGRHTSSYGPIYVFRHALHPPPKATPAAPTPPPAVGAVSGSPFDGQGMWIWYLNQSNGGNIGSLVAKAHAAGEPLQLSEPRRPTHLHARVAMHVWNMRRRIQSAIRGFRRGSNW